MFTISKAAQAVRSTPPVKHTTSLRKGGVLVKIADIAVVVLGFLLAVSLLLAVYHWSAGRSDDFLADAQEEITTIMDEVENDILSSIRTRRP